MAAKYNDEGSPLPNAHNYVYEEGVNRKLFNSSSNNIEVYLRIRRLLGSEEPTAKKGLQVVVDGRSLSLMPIPRPGISTPPSHKYNFTSVFSPASGQTEVYKEAMEPAVMRFINGKDILFFAYGASGSGKTFSIHGNPQDPGLVPQAIEQIFENLGDRQIPGARFKPSRYMDIVKLTPAEEEEELKLREKLLKHPIRSLDSSCYSYSTASETSSQFSQDSLNSRSLEESVVTLNQHTKIPLHSPIYEENDMYYAVWISFAEFYNEGIYDLLDVDNMGERKARRLQLVQDNQGRIYIKGITEVCVHNAEEASKIMALGRQALHVASTNINQRSSRSHCIMTLRLVKVSELEDPDFGHICHMSVCDLAGSERMNKAGGDKKRAQEAGNIHTSLMVLGRCLEALRYNQSHLGEKKPIPFRESKLTRLFQTFLLGGGQISMLAAISPSASMIEETQQTLKFSALTQQVVTVQTIPSRLTDAWLQTNRHWNSLAPTQTTNSPELEEQIEEKDVMLQEMASLIRGLELEVIQCKEDRLKVEYDVRKEVAKEYAHHISELRASYMKRVEAAQAKTKEVREKYKRLREEMENEESEEDEEEANKILEEKLGAVRKQLQRALEERDQLQEEKTQQAFEWSTKETADSKKMASLEAQLAQLGTEHQEKVSTLELQLAELRHQLSLQDKQMDDPEVCQLREELARQTRANATLEEELTSVQSQLQTVLKKQEENCRELKQDSRQLAAVEAELEELRSQLSLQESHRSQEIASREEQLTELRKQLAVKEEELVSVQSQLQTLLKEQEENCKELKQKDSRQLAAVEAELEELHSQLSLQESHHSQEVASLEDQLTELRKELAAKEQELKEQSGNVEKAVMDKTTELAQLRDQLKEQVEAVVTQKLTLEQLLEEKEVDSRTQEAATQQKMASLEAEVEVLQDKLLQQELDSTIKMASLEAEVEELNKKLSQKKSSTSQKVTSLEAEVEELHNKLSQTESENSLMVASLKAEVEDLQNQLSQTESGNCLKISSLEAEVEDLQNQLSQTESGNCLKISSLEAEVEDLQNQLSQTESGNCLKISSLEAEVEGLQKKLIQKEIDNCTKVASLEAEVEVLQSQLSQTESDNSTKVASLETELEELTKKLSQKESDNSTKVASLEAELEDLSKKLSQKESDNSLKTASLEAEVEELQSKLSQKDSENSQIVDSLEAQVKELNKKLSQKECDNSQKVASLEKEVEELESQLSQKERDNAAKVASLEAEVGKLRKEQSLKKSTKSKKVSSLESQLAELQKELSLKEVEIKEQKFTIEKAGEIFIENSSELDELKKNLAEQVKATKEQELEVKDLTQKLKEAEARATKAQTAPSNNKMLMEDNSKLKKALNEKEQALEEVKSKVLEQGKDLEKFALENNDLRLELEQAAMEHKEEISKLKASIDKSHKKEKNTKHKGLNEEISTIDQTSQKTVIKTLSVEMVETELTSNKVPKISDVSNTEGDISLMGDTSGAKSSKSRSSNKENLTKVTSRRARTAKSVAKSPKGKLTESNNRRPVRSTRSTLKQQKKAVEEEALHLSEEDFEDMEQPEEEWVPTKPVPTRAGRRQVTQKKKAIEQPKEESHGSESGEAPPPSRANRRRKLHQTNKQMSFSPTQTTQEDENLSPLQMIRSQIMKRQLRRRD